MSDEAAIEASGTDKQEYPIHTVISHSGSVDNPSTVWITVEWGDKSTSAINLPTCKHVEKVQKYLLDLFPTNTNLQAYFTAAGATTGRGKRFRFASRKNLKE